MLTIISTYKNRRHHIEKTWLTWEIQSNHSYQILIVDYKSDDNLKSLFENHKHKVKTIHTRCENVFGFCISHARNIGARIADSEWLCFLDVDTYLHFNFIEWVLESIKQSKGNFYLAAEDSHVRKEIINGGLIICKKTDHDRIFGFNENFQGWGYEDIDYKIRLENNGMRRLHIPDTLYSCIQHPDQERTQCHSVEKETSWTRNRQISLRTWDNLNYGEFHGSITEYSDNV